MFSNFININKNILRFSWVLLFIVLTTQIFIGQSNISETINKNIELADDYFQEGNKTEAAKLYNQSAYLLHNNNQPNQAIELYKKVLSLNKELNNRNGQLKTHNKLALLYLEVEQYDQAIFHFDQELNFRRSFRTDDSKAEVVSILANKASAQSSISQTDEALKTIEQATNLALELNDLTLLKLCYGTTYDIYNSIGNTNKASEYFNLYSVIDNKIKDQKMAAVRDEAAQKVNQAVTEKVQAEEQLNQTSEKLVETEHTLQEAEQLTEKQKLKIQLQEERINAEKAKRRTYAIGLSVLSVFVIVLLLMIWQIRNANKKINEQRKRLERQNKEIKASIRYAKTIQSAILPDVDEIKKRFDIFMLYKPKDIVSGDFYWSLEHEKNGHKSFYFAIVDCTGHGVPGAFMSMIGSRILTEIVKQRNITSPAEILEKMNELIQVGLRQDQTDNNDGMDIGICQISKKNGKDTQIIFAGAKRPLYIYRNNSQILEVIKGDRKSIGGNQEFRKKIQFTDKTLILGKGDSIYMFSDGLTDQNSPNRKKFGRIRFEEIITACAEDSMERQHQIFSSQLNDFMGDEEQRDDITLAGIRI